LRRAQVGRGPPSGGLSSVIRSPTFVGIDLVPSKGGPFKSVGYFQRALGGRVVSFTHPDDRGEALGEVTGGYTHVWSTGGRLGRFFLWTRGAELRRADALLPGTTLLSLHILYRHSAHWVASRARRHGIPYWVVPHGCLDPYVFTYRAGIKRVWMRLFGRRILREARHVIFSSRRELEKAAVWLAPGHPNARVVHWPVEVPAAAEVAEARSAGRARLGVGDGEAAFLFLGRLHSMKRPMETLEAFARARATSAVLWFAGPDGDVSARQLMARAAALGVSDRVRCHGAVFGQQKLELTAAADVYVSLSARENFNHAAAEALAAGRLVLLSPGNDLGPELVAAGAAHVLRSDAVDEAAGEIAACSTMGREERDAIGARGRAWAEAHLSFDRFAAALRQLAAER
jgi:glycosyltransferase involved in cell wall biosynthesis